MEVKFGSTDWSQLKGIRDDIRAKRISDRGIEVARKLQVGLADAIDAEILRLEMRNERAIGGVVLSVDLIVTPDQTIKQQPQKKRNLLQEFEEILSGGGST